MSKRCRDCNGRGRWVETHEENDHGDIVVVSVWHECQTCKGTGISQDADDGEDFDIGGDSYADD